MIVIDSSAILAILFMEKEAALFAGFVEEAGRVAVSAASMVETGMVLVARVGEEGRRDLEDFVVAGNVEVMPVTERQAALAINAFERFGKGRHPAGLNFGDCFSYALAMDKGLPLLFKGNDFSRTDIRCVL